MYVLMELFASAGFLLLQKPTICVTDNPRIWLISHVFIYFHTIIIWLRADSRPSKWVANSLSRNALRINQESNSFLAACIKIYQDGLGVTNQSDLGIVLSTAVEHIRVDEKDGGWQQSFTCEPLPQFEAF